jgi:hypothetical protein
VLPPDYLATIACAPNDTPPNCTIQIQWAEKTVAVNKDGLTQSAAQNLPVYELYVEP